MNRIQEAIADIRKVLRLYVDFDRSKGTYRGAIKAMDLIEAELLESEPEPTDYTEIRNGTIRSKICELMSDMLDNPDDSGIYPTSKFMWEMETYILTLLGSKPESKCKTCGDTGQIGDEQQYLGRSVGYKACPVCQSDEEVVCAECGRVLSENPEPTDSGEFTKEYWQWINNVVPEAGWKDRVIKCLKEIDRQAEEIKNRRILNNVLIEASNEERRSAKYLQAELKDYKRQTEALKGENKFLSDAADMAKKLLDDYKAELKSVKNTICEAHYPYPKISPHDDICPYCELIKQDNDIKAKDKRIEQLEDVLLTLKDTCGSGDIELIEQVLTPKPPEDEKGESSGKAVT